MCPEMHNVQGHKHELKSGGHNCERCSEIKMVIIFIAQIKVISAHRCYLNVILIARTKFSGFSNQSHYH